MPDSPDSERSSQGDRLQIRLVPYTPTRLSGGSSLNLSALAESARDNVEIHSADESPIATSPPSSGSTIAGPSRPSIRRRNTSVELGDVPPIASPSELSESSPTEPQRGRFRSQSVVSQSLRTLTAPPSPEIQPTAPAQRRTKRFVDINLNSDNKTFSLVPLKPTRPRTDSVVSARTDTTTHHSVISTRTDTTTQHSVVSTQTDQTPHYSVASSGSYAQQTSSIFSEDRPSSPLTTLAEDDSTSATASFTPSIPEEDFTAASPWNYKLVGGLRKVQRDVSESSDLPTPTRLPSFLEEEPSSPKALAPQEPISAYTLTTKASFQSNKTGNTVSDRTNYKTYAQSSSAPDTVRNSVTSDFDNASLFPGGPNYVVYDGASASGQSRGHSHTHSNSNSNSHSDSEQQRNPNYVVHGHRRTMSDGTDISHAQSEYSRDSMVVAPLRPVRSHRLHSSSTVMSSRSLEHLRTGSLNSISTSPTRANQDAERDGSVGVSTQIDLDGRHAATPSGSGQAVHRRAGSRTQPWGTALSTVLSESERTDPSTRSHSRMSGNARSSVFTLNQLRQTGSFSTLGMEEALAMASHSRNGSVDRPQPVYGRDTQFPNARLIRDHDEDGDGLADLESMNRLPSRARGLSFLSNNSGEKGHRSSRSTSSSGGNSISYSAAIPAWARVYYGSGERRWLAPKPSNESMFSQFTSSLHRDGSHSRSPSYEQYTADINNPRRRPHEPKRRRSESDSMEIRPHPFAAVARSIKKQTSSIWSPHLRQDRRASRYSLWSPPSLADSAEFGIWQRNLQLVLFVFGFLCPFVWMVGAVLPIPTRPERDMTERRFSDGNIDLRTEARTQMQYINAERLHDRVKWWRSVNRRMSIIGALILCLCIVLIVVGVKQQWHS
ncbi:hypothetical protein ACHAPX_007950 [Trichoderma viride]